MSLARISVRQPRALGAMRDRPDSMGLLGTLGELPSLCIVGEHDQLTPPDRASAMADALAGSRLAVVPGAGHLTPVEQPQATTTLLAEFLKGLGTRE